MKAKLTVTIEEKLIPEIKTIATLKGKSVSAMIEEHFSKLLQNNPENFVEKWKGKFEGSKRHSKKDERYEYLIKKHS